MRKELYKTILKSHLCVNVNKKVPGCINSFIFMHDEAQCNKGRTVTQFLEVHGVQTLSWTGNSPVMNPIKNLWSILKINEKD